MAEVCSFCGGDHWRPDCPELVPMKFNLITTIFPAEAERMCEFRYCLEQNLANPLIKHVYVFIENPWTLVEVSWLDKPNVSFIEVKERPRYKDYFEFANRELAGQMVLICNTDMWYNRTLDRAVLFHFPVLVEGSTTLLAITRYNVHNQLKELRAGDTIRAQLQGWEVGGNCGSQDTWIFKAPIKPFDWDIVVGIIGCDSLLAQRAQEAGISVFNPAESIYTFHLHHAPVRNDVLPDGFTYWKHPDYRAVSIPFCSA